MKSEARRIRLLKLKKTEKNPLEKIQTILAKETKKEKTQENPQKQVKRMVRKRAAKLKKERLGSFPCSPVASA